MNTKLEPEGRLYFSATSGPDNLLYEVDIDLYDKVDVDVCADCLQMSFLRIYMVIDEFVKF